MADKPKEYEVISKVEAMEIANNLIWGNKNLHEVFASAETIWVWVDEHVENVGVFSTLKGASGFIAGIKTARCIAGKENG